LLGWKRITADVRNCYYQASRQVKFVHDKIIRYLMHTFVSDNLQTYFSGDNEQMSDQDRLCKIAIDFSEHLNSLKQAEDECTRVCVIFVIMAGDFLQFVSAYRNADSIGVEIGYHIFAPVWKELSQSKYLERHWDQQDFLFRKFPFSRLQEARINRFVRRYPIETGKSNLAQDECLEIGNKFYATFPDVQTLDGFARQGNYVGPSLMCKRFVTMFYSSIATNDTTVFVQGSAPDMSPEKKMLYEIISLFLGEHASSDTRTFTSDSLSPSKLKPHLKTDLKRKKLDQAVSSNRVDSASQLLNFMNHMNVKDINPPVDVEGAMAENDDNVNIDPDEVEGLRAIAEDLMSSVVFSGERESDESPQCTKELHHACLIDIWAVGTNKIIAMNPMSIRMEAENRSERKKMVSQYIIDQVNRMKRDVTMIEIGGEMTDCENAPWTKFVMDARK
jgi:hypothetical protein